MMVNTVEYLFKSRKKLYLQEMTKVTMMTRDSTAASHQHSPHLVIVSRMRSPMALKQHMPRRQPTVMLPGWRD